MRLPTSGTRTQQIWHREFLEELVAIDVPPSLVQAWIAGPALAVDIDVTDVSPDHPDLDR